MIEELYLLLQSKKVEVYKKNFYEFCKFFDSKFFTPSKTYLKEICSAFQKVSEGKIKKLSISLPPRSGKSYVTSLWCAWEIGRQHKNPDLSIMRNAYGDALAQKFSYDIRAMIQNPKYLIVFPEIKLKADKQKVNDWAIEGANQSTYFCAGVGGAITGKGCRTAAILDDGVKNIEEAMSNDILEKKWLWITSTHYSRMESGCANIFIGTRWSIKDPIGRAIEEDPNDWTIIKIPALIDGKSFCEEVRSTEELLHIKKITPDFIWQAEYMQEPIESKGLLFPKNELNRFSLQDIMPYLKGDKQFDAIFGYTDTADEGLDYLASGVVGVIGNKYFLLDVIYTQEPVEITIPRVAKLIQSTKQTYHIIEANAGGKIFALQVQKLVSQELKHNCYIKWKPNTTNKETRILMQSGIVKEYFYFRNDFTVGSEYDKFFSELTSYVRLGKNAHDDATDCITGLAEMISKGNSINILGRGLK